MLGALVARLAWPSLRLDYFFDEAWRASLVRTPWQWSRYLKNDTPLPPGWLISMWAWFTVLPGRRSLVRAVAAGPALVALLLVTDVVRRLLSRTRSARRASGMAVAATVLLLLEPGLAHQVTYLNNYFVEIALGAALVWSAVAAGEHPSATGRVASACCFAGPFLTQGGLFLLPAALWWRSQASPAQRRSSHPLALLALAASCSLVSYLVFLRPVARNGQVAGFWRPEAVSGLGVVGWVHRWWITWFDLTVPRRFGDGVLVTALVVALAAVGCWFVTSRSRWWMAAVASAQLIAWLASLAVEWPVTVVRLNLGFDWMLMVLPPLGAVLGAEACFGASSRLVGARWPGRLPDLLHAAFGTAGVVAVLVVCWPADVLSAASSTEPFARGLTDDLGVIAASAQPGDAVLGYHVMSGWYLHDRLTLDTNLDLVLLDEATYGHRLTEEPDELVERSAPSARGVWCVVPFELGPEGSAAACRLDPGVWVADPPARLGRCEIRHWRRRE